MYYYIYDSFTQNPKYSKEISKINQKLTDLDILGEEVKVTPIRKIRDLVEEAVRKDCKNIIAVGDDSTICSVIQYVANQTWDGCLGLIPLKESRIAKVLGIPQGEQASDVISARRIEKIDLGRINNNQHFLTSVKITSDKSFTQSNALRFRNLKCAFQQKYPKVKLKFAEGFTVICKFLMLSILNTLDNKKGKLEIKTQEQNVRLQVSPQDGLLDIVIVGAQSKLRLLKNISQLERQDFRNIPNLSFFRTKRVEISSQESISCLADGQLVKSRPLIIEVVPKKLNVIVGKERGF